MALKALSVVREEFRKTRGVAMTGNAYSELTDLERRITDRFYRECLGQTEARPADAGVAVASRDWVEYGKAFYYLCYDLSQKGESIVGMQVDIQRSEKHPSCAGLLLVGHVEAGSVISEGERFEEIDNV
ncbi:hypothetical protein LCGC14_3003000, partial [marine sediment metagenome]